VPGCARVTINQLPTLMYIASADVARAVDHVIDGRGSPTPRCADRRGRKSVVTTRSIGAAVVCRRVSWSMCIGSADCQIAAVTASGQSAGTARGPTVTGSVTVVANDSIVTE
jgi:hypothetical protein